MAGLSDELVQLVQDRASVIFDAAVIAVEAATRDAAPVGATGLLADSVGIVDRVEGVVLTATIAATAEYASFTDTGVGAYTQDTVPLYSFEWANGPRGDGRYAFRSVHHDARPGTNWFEQPMQERWDSALTEAANA